MRKTLKVGEKSCSSLTGRLPCQSIFLSVIQSENLNVNMIPTPFKTICSKVHLYLGRIVCAT